MAQKTYKTAYEYCESCKASGLQDGLYGPVDCENCAGQGVVRIRDENGRYATKEIKH